MELKEGVDERHVGLSMNILEGFFVISVTLYVLLFNWWYLNICLPMVYGAWKKIELLSNVALDTFWETSIDFLSNL